MPTLPIVLEVEAGRSEPRPYKGVGILDGHGGAVPLHEVEGPDYFAEAISSTMDWVAARGSGAAVMGRPTTRKSAPALMASVGVAVRAWSSVFAAGLDFAEPVALLSDFISGRTPGVTMRKSRPQALRMARASWTLATTPSTPADFASLANFTTRVFGGPPIPTSRIAFASMLVSTVTAMRRGRSAPIGTPALMAWAAAWSIAVPPSAWTLTSCTPVIAALDRTAPATVFGMS